MASSGRKAFGGAILAGALSLLVLAVSANPALAFELFGIRLWGSPKADPSAYPYTVQFRIAGANRALVRDLRDASTLYREQDTPPHSAAALLARARGDYAHLIAALYAQGRYGGSVSILLDGRRVEDITPDAPLPKPAPILVTVNPGPVFTFGRISIRGRPPPDPRVKRPEQVGLFPGGIAKSEIIMKAEDALVDGWRVAGRPKAKIANRQIVANHPSRTLNVSLTVEPGPRAHFGALTVSGANRVDPRFIVRQAQIPAGAQYDPRDIRRARDELRRLETFQSIRVIEGDVAPDGYMPVEIAVVERKPRVVGLGAKYSTVDGAEVTGYWQHRNLFGRAERLRIEGSVGGGESTDYGDLDYGLAATFVKPGAFTPRTDFTAFSAAKKQQLEAYDEESVAGRVGLTHRFTPDLTGLSFASIEHSRIEDALGTRDFLFASLPTQMLYDSRDNEFDPTRGFNITAAVEPFTETKFGNSGAITEAKLATYRSFRSDGRLILAGRVAAGSITGAPLDELPANRLFFLGGDGSIRGYAYRSIGPRLPNGDIIGGRSYFAGSVELRTKVTDTIGLVPFLDFGAAYASEFPDFSEEMQVGAGVGLRYYTALGPVRVDLAVPLNPRREDEDFAFYIGIGQEF